MKRTWLLLCLFAVGAAVSADATTIVYDNAGPGSWNTGSPYINSGSSVADSFTLNSAATIDGISFGNWLTPGDTLESVSWQFTTASNGGTILGSGTATSFSNVNEGDPFGYVANDSTFGIPSLSLNANTTYYLELSNAASAWGYFIGWDESDNPQSTAIQYMNGATFDDGSETFALLSNYSPVPEPSSLILLGSGLAGLLLFGLTRRRTLSAPQTGSCA